MGTLNRKPGVCLNTTVFVSGKALAAGSFGQLPAASAVRLTGLEQLPAASALRLTVLEYRDRLLATGSPGIAEFFNVVANAADKRGQRGRAERFTVDPVEALWFQSDRFSSGVIENERDVEHESIHVFLSGPGTFFVNVARRITLSGF